MAAPGPRSRPGSVRSPTCGPSSPSPLPRASRSSRIPPCARASCASRRAGRSGGSVTSTSMRSSWRVIAAALGGFSLLTLAIFRPSPSELAHTAPAFRGSAADALLLMWATSHVSRALFSAPLHLFDAGIFYPLRHTLALYFALTMTAIAALALVAAPTRRAGRLRAGMLLGPLAMVAAIAPTLWPYLALRGAQGTVRTGGLDTGLAFFLPGPGTLSAWLAGWHERLGFGPGFAVWMLALIGVVAGRRARDRFAWAANLAGLGVTLALILTPIRLQLAIPGLDMVRNTNRAFHVSLAFLAFFVAQAVAWLQGLAAAPRRRAAVGALLVLAVAAEMGLPPGERKRLPFGDEIPPAY